MKQLIALIATTVALSAFAADAPKKEEKKAEAKPAAAAPAPAAAAPAAPAAPAPAAKKEEKKAEAKKWLLVKRSQAILYDPDDAEDYEIVELDDLPLHRGYSRPKLFKNIDDISDHAKFRLMFARLRALERYREIWT